MTKPSEVSVTPLSQDSICSPRLSGFSSSRSSSKTWVALCLLVGEASNSLKSSSSSESKTGLALFKTSMPSANPDERSRKIDGRDCVCFFAGVGKIATEEAVFDFVGLWMLLAF